MHKSYQPTLPAANRLLQQKWDQKYYSEHQILVRDARPSIDTRPPRTYMHHHMKLKKLQLAEERTATIERDNRILLEKMANIMRSGSRLDNHNDYPIKTLHHEKRRRELLRVSRENSTMVKRIMDRKPEFNQNDWTNSWSRNLLYLDNISKYEYNWQNSRPSTRQVHSRQQSSRRAASAPRASRRE